MALADLTDPQAVESALAEFDALGRTAFLRRYGFGPARKYFIEHNGTRYDSKAVVGAAHGHQHARPLRHEEFNGGEQTVVARLTALGFTLVDITDDWRIEQGQLATRTEIHGEYGGASQGGIEPSASTPNVMIYTDRASGATHGYDYDGWDEVDGNVFYYTGDGQVGDQEIKDGNKAILNHEADGRTLRLFEFAQDQRRGGKLHRYVGAFYVDPSDPYRFEPAPDRNGDLRQVIVFRLIRDGEVPRSVAAAPPRTVPVAREAEPVAEITNDTTPTPDSDDMAALEAVYVPSEDNIVDSYEIAPTTGRDARRNEAKLVRQFEAWLESQRHEVCRIRITVPGERATFVTDTYDKTDDVLYEAKSKADRATIRLAIGQLIDYNRAARASQARLLLPDEPSPDLKALIRSAGFGLAYRRLGAWVIEG